MSQESDCIWCRRAARMRPSGTVLCLGMRVIVYIFARSAYSQANFKLGCVASLFRTFVHRDETNSARHTTHSNPKTEAHAHQHVDDSDTMPLRETNNMHHENHYDCCSSYAAATLQRSKNRVVNLCGAYPSTQTRTVCIKYVGVSECTNVCALDAASASAVSLNYFARRFFGSSNLLSQTQQTASL